MCRDRGFRPAGFLPQPVPRSLQPSFVHPIRIHHNSIFSGHSGYSGVGANVQMFNQLAHVTKFFSPRSEVRRAICYILFKFTKTSGFKFKGDFMSSELCNLCPRDEWVGRQMIDDDFIEQWSQVCRRPLCTMKTSLKLHKL